MTGRMRIRRVLDQGSVGSDVTVAGWARSVRSGKGVTFIALNDGSCLGGIQIVVGPELRNFEEVARLGTGSSLSVAGKLVESPAAGQRFELVAATVTVYQHATPDYPLQKKRHSFEYLRSIAHLRPRTNTFGALFRLRSFLSQAIHQFFGERGFLCVHTPIITGNDCEGAGELFRVTTLDPAALSRTPGGVELVLLLPLE